ncbi:plasmid mobilization relaxosome protein MobC [Rhizobium sp. BR 317]|uniref:plasmid mobilization protein n=1 Tax=Rhizobium sp. BR 317 TaxID=3040015 RepID=UPI0039BFA18C
MAVTDGRSQSLGPAEARKERVIHVRLAVSEHAAVEHAAAAADMTVSGFMRSLALEGAGIQPFLTEDDRTILDILASQMRAIGVNLNQLTRTANRAGQIDADGVSSALIDIQQIVVAVAMELRCYSVRAARRRGAA